MERYSLDIALYGGVVLASKLLFHCKFKQQQERSILISKFMFVEEMMA